MKRVKIGPLSRRFICLSTHELGELDARTGLTGSGKTCASALLSHICVFHNCVAADASISSVCEPVAGLMCELMAFFLCLSILWPHWKDFFCLFFFTVQDT